MWFQQRQLEAIDEQVTHTRNTVLQAYILRGLIMASNVTQNPNASSLDCGINQNAWDIALPILYFTIFPPALLLNLVVAWICLHLKANSTFMVYLKHLVAADLLMTLTFPIRGASELPEASHGLHAFACRFSSVFFYLAMNMSVILMGLISLDRYLKIAKTLETSLESSA
ncbi:hypothetical protein AMELA_G00219100 [Ameiurus melas]|uniref:G-protein coupled receptors family 1 profile domain-containing protein n=1 Tax=Ameiurus melas TaxID=219545 RepID=A0A7J6A210_AMEME|nr:hypothetical protein AMELA_G00219100 [Ameiurus melas]